MVGTSSIPVLSLSLLALCGCSNASSRPGAAGELQTAGSSRIAFSRGAPAGGIYVMTAAGSRPRRVTGAPGDDAPAWSPDGSKIAFIRNRRGSQDIYVVQADGRWLERLTTDGASFSPAWSPDGTSIAFARETPGNADIYVMKADGARVRRLTHGPLLGYSPAWSPDGTRIAYVAYGKGPPSSATRLYVMNADGSRTRTIGSDNVALPSWSPDGTEIAFVNEETGSVYLINSSGSGLHQVVDLASLPNGRHFPQNFTSRPAWSPDGRRIVFAGGRIGSSHLYVVNLAGSGLAPLTHGAVEDQDPAWSGERRALR